MMCNIGEYVRLKIPGRSRKLRIDKCMVDVVLEFNDKKYKTIMCCCGHGIYPTSLIVKFKPTGEIYEWFSGITLGKRKSYYKLDKKTKCYFIPETLNQTNPVYKNKVK